MKVKVSKSGSDLLKQWSSVFKALGYSVEFLKGLEEVCLNGIPNDGVDCRYMDFKGDDINLYCNGVNITLVQEQMKCEFSIEDSEKDYNLCIAVNNPSDEMRKNGEMLQITASLGHVIKSGTRSTFSDFFLDIRQYIDGAKVNKRFYGILAKKDECEEIPFDDCNAELYFRLIKSVCDDFDVIKNNQEAKEKLGFIFQILLGRIKESLADYRNSIKEYIDGLKQRKKGMFDEYRDLLSGISRAYDSAVTQIDLTIAEWEECLNDNQYTDSTDTQSSMGRGSYVKVNPIGTPMGSGK